MRHGSIDGQGASDILNTLYIVAGTKIGVGTDSPGGTIGILDANTYITRDGSNNLSFTDAITGTKTLAELVTTSSPSLDDAYNEGSTITVDTGSVTLNSSITSTALDINQTANGNAVEIDNDGTQHGLYIHQDGNLASTKHGFYLYSDVALTSSALAKIHADNASMGQSLMEMVQDGGGSVLKINANNTLNSGAYAIYAATTSAQTNTQGNMLYLSSTNASNNKDMCRIFYNGGANLLYAAQSGNGTGINVLAEGTGNALALGNSGDGPHINFYGDPTVASPSDGNFWFDGSELKMRIGSTTYNLDKTAASDENVKENITSTQYALSDLLDLEVVDFNYKDFYMTEPSGTTHTGLIAQSVETIFPEAVKTEDCVEFSGMSEIKSIDYKKLVPLCIKAIQDLEARVAALEA